MRVPAEEIAAAAQAWIGTPYRHRAATRGAGCDCLGLVLGVFRTLYGFAPEAPAYGPDWRDGRHAAELLALAERWLVPAHAGAGRPLTLTLSPAGRGDAAGGIVPGAGQVVLFRMRGSGLPRHCGIMVTDRRFVHAQERLGVVEAELAAGWARRVAGVFGFPER